MTDFLDPYHARLGIGPQDQPPRHHRLPGIWPVDSEWRETADSTKRRMAQVERLMRPFRESDAKARFGLIGTALGGVAGTLLTLAIICPIRALGSSTTQASVSRPSAEARTTNDAPSASQGDSESDVSTQSRKLTPPSSEEQKTAERGIRKVLGKQFAAARTPEQHSMLAEALLKAGIETPEKSATRYVLLQLAAERAAAAGNLSIAARAIDEIGRDYDADIMAMKADALAEAVGSTRTARQPSAYLKETIRIAMSLIDEAVVDDNYQMASRLSELVTASARRAKNLPLVRVLAIRKRELQRLDQEFVSAREAHEVLADDPSNREANLTAGRWYCFRKGNWNKGLPFLAKGADTVLAELAKRESTNTEDPGERVELGNAWWDLFEKEKGAEKARFLQRAMYWYELALPDLSGLSKMTIERRRLEALTAAADPSGSRMLGAVKEGNVALASDGTTISVRGENATVLPVGAEDVRSLSRVLDGGFSVWSRANHPCEWTIVFPEIYRLQEIRFVLIGDAGIFSRYAVATSPDGQEYRLLTDRSRGEWRGLQKIRFYPRSVKAVKVRGLYASPVLFFQLGKFEAFCIPPDASPE